MNASVDDFLNSFDSLSERDKHQALTELLRRTLREAPSEVPDEALVAAAEELFLELDAREAADAQP